MHGYNPTNVRTICEYIIAEQTEINIKDSTREGKIKDSFVDFQNSIEDKSFIKNDQSMIF